MNRWNVFCNENAPYRIYYRQIDDARAVGIH